MKSLQTSHFLGLALAIAAGTVAANWLTARYLRGR